MGEDVRLSHAAAMATSSRSSIVVPSSDQVDSTWQLVHVEKLGRRGKKQSPTMAQAPSLQHRRGRTEGNRRLSMFKMRSRSHTTSTTSMGHGLSPSVSVESQQSHHTPTEGERPESCWSDSDNSDRRTKSWVAKGSRLLKKQNSKFSLSSSKRSTWVEESDEASEPYPELLARGYNKHDRMGSASDGRMDQSPIQHIKLTHNPRPSPSSYHLQALQL